MKECNFCSSENTSNGIRKFEGISKTKLGDWYYIYAKDYRGINVYIGNVKYCPMCGRKLEEELND